VFTHVAAFHFVQDHAHPIGALTSALEKRTCTPDTLIVLPEAFNLGKPYQAGPAAFRRDDIIAGLLAISEAEAHAFVVGLLEDQPPSGENPHSSVYFVDRSGPRLICHKQYPDGQGDYTTCPVAPDDNNPIVLEDTTIVSLICMDVQNSNRCDRLGKCAQAAKKSQNLICIPAAMSTEWFGIISVGKLIQLISPQDQYKSHIIMANSCATSNSPLSFVTDTGWFVAQCVATKEQNELEPFKL